MDSNTVNMSQLKRKRRRNSSPMKADEQCNVLLVGDSRKKLSQIISTDDDTSIAFSDRLLRFTPNMKLVQYQIVVTEKKLYLLKDKSGKLKVSLSLNLIKAICLSHQSDNFMLLKVKNQSDIILVSRRKTKLTEILMRQSMNENTAVPLSTMDRFTFTMDGVKYIMVFTREKDYSVRTSIYLDKQQDSVTFESKGSKKRAK